ncbi:MAG TPA: mechanosensitive ion channel domain-containing protein, partial [bacterium]|nr:mechanosensitive ion channel domain-containing protein [bacterium]
MPGLLVAHISPWVKGPVVFAAWSVGLIVVMRIAYGRLKRLSRRTRTHLDDIILHALSRPLVIMILVSGGFIVSRILPLPPQWDRGLILAVKVLVIIAGVVFADRLAEALIRHYSGRVDYLRDSSGIIHTAVRAVVILLALLVILETIGVAITPLIASLGVGSLAIALALQSPLANFFAGLQIVADKPVQLGQYIRLATGEEGTVTKIGWRSTSLAAPSSNFIVIPNSKVADAIITNFDMPGRETSVTVQVSVHYDSDLDRVERVTSDVARQVLKEVEGGKKDYTPIVRFSSFG